MMRRGIDDFIQTVADLEDLFEATGRTCQVTYRIAYRPPYLVRINNHVADDKDGPQYYQATGSTISEACEMAYQAFLDHEEAPGIIAGRKKQPKEGPK